MVSFQRHIFQNGLTVLYHQDPFASLASFNLIYKVGSRDEQADKTGLAHLFEHLMFEGSQFGQSFDAILERAGGECNAFTNSDMTDYYCMIPVDNSDTILYLESVRMQHLSLSKEEIDTQRKVVIEEFKETCLNIPYGDTYHDLLDLNYATYSYKWPVIGKTIAGIEALDYDDFYDFYKRYYDASNAVISIVSPLDWDTVFDKMSFYFEPIPSALKRSTTAYTDEPLRTQSVRRDVIKDIPKDSLYLSWLMPARDHQDYYAIDLLSDILATGKASRLYQDLVKEKQMAHHVDAYITGVMGPGLFVVEAKPAQGVDLKELESVLLQHVQALREQIVKEGELKRHMLRIENGILFGENDPLNKAMHLGYFEVLGDAALINNELERYTRLTVNDLQAAAQKYLNPDHVAVLRELKPEDIA